MVGGRRSLALVVESAIRLLSSVQEGSSGDLAMRILFANTFALVMFLIALASLGSVIRSYFE